MGWTPAGKDCLELLVRVAFVTLDSDCQLDEDLVKTTERVEWTRRPADVVFVMYLILVEDFAAIGFAARACQSLAGATDLWPAYGYWEL